jgi:hypothetical protein
MPICAAHVESRMSGGALPPHQPSRSGRERDDRQRRADLETGPKADRHALRAGVFVDAMTLMGAKPAGRLRAQLRKRNARAVPAALALRPSSWGNRHKATPLFYSRADQPTKRVDRFRYPA